jgi:hypothetical protein
MKLLSTKHSKMKSRLYIILALSILFGACASNSLRKQRKHYKKATSGVKYNGYKTTSKYGLAGSMNAHNRQQPDSLQIRAPYAHLFLGYFWSVSGKSSFAFAEADIVEEISNEGNDSQLKHLAQGLRAITMYQAGWDKLAAEESMRARENFSTGQASSHKHEVAAIYLLMGTLYIKEKDFDKARFFWGGFAKETGIEWPYHVCDAAGDFHAGNVQQGLQKVKTISQDPAVPKPVRDELVVQLQKVEAAAGSSVNSSWFWPSIIGKIIWQELGSSSRQSLDKLAKAIEDVTAKL